MQQSSQTNTFVVVANRLPVDITIENGERTFRPSPGGLVAALSPVLAQHQGCWVGWPGTTAETPEPFRTEAGVLLYPVGLDSEEYERFYEGFSNATLWPLYHDLIVTPTYHNEWWESYREVNDKFARAVAAVAAPGATVWVQDYQLQLVPGILRQIRPDLTIGFFLHIPFPAPDLFRQLPWREETVRGILGADLIGFHLVAGAQNFLDLTKQVASPAGSTIGQPHELEVLGHAELGQVSATISSPDGRLVGVGAFPISIDVEEISKLLASMDGSPHSEVATLRERLGNPDTLLLGVDRLDYTKGILQRLAALEQLFESGALDPATTLMIQVATPSRERVDHYKRTRSEVEEAVGRINGRFGQLARPVVHYLHRSLSKEQLVTLYAAADIMLVTPYKDGMNLVAKEYIACHPGGDGALVLSEFAGAATELNQAYLCNPFDIESIKKQIVHAATDLRMHPDQAEAAMRAMVEQVRTHDVNHWAASFLDCLLQRSSHL